MVRLTRLKLTLRDLQWLDWLCSLPQKFQHQCDACACLAKNCITVIVHVNHLRFLTL
ncbi:hypothetical protein RSAG8_09320, partial [Rhizoctonia solani AG-8 WAC10335]